MTTSVPVDRPLPALHNPKMVSLLLQLVSRFCPRLSFLKLSDCHSVTADTFLMLAKACCQLHSLDLHHSTVSPLPWGWGWGDPEIAWAPCDVSRTFFGSPGGAHSCGELLGGGGVPNA